MAGSPGASASAERTAVTASGAAALRLRDLRANQVQLDRKAAATPAAATDSVASLFAARMVQYRPTGDFDLRAASRASRNLPSRNRHSGRFVAHAAAVRGGALLQLGGGPLGLPRAVVQLRDGFVHAADRRPAASTRR